MRRRQNYHQAPLRTRILIFLHFWLYYVPIGLPLMCITAPIWILGIVARTPLWDIGDVTLFFFVAPGLAFNWLVRVYRRAVLNPYRLYRDERRIRRLEPLPLPVKRPRRLSEGRRVRQTAALLTKLPLEIRQMIYEDVITCGSEHRHIFEIRKESAKTGTSHRQRWHIRNRIWGAGCIAGLTSHCAFENHFYLTRSAACWSHTVLEPNPYVEKNSAGGPIALAKTCRQIYLETIDMYYERQTFCFDKLGRPPYFIRGTLPHRMSKIRDIHLHFYYAGILDLDDACQPTPEHMRQCHECSFCCWLDLIQSSMTGLRTVEMTTTVPHVVNHAIYPTMQNAWVARLLVFQHAIKADINFELIAPDSYIMRNADLEALKDFETQLRTELARARARNAAVIDVLET
ncbi:MAG: hypothetical protein Q9195_005704 [Heterodermia aff. obscurata]